MGWLLPECAGRRLECDFCKAKTRKPHFFKLGQKGGSTGVYFSQGRKTYCPNCQRRERMGRFLRCTEDVQRIMQKHWQQASAFPDAPWNDMLQQLTDEDLIAMNRRCVEMNQRCVKEIIARDRMGQHARTTQEASESVPHRLRESRQAVPEEDAQTPRRQERKEVQVAPPGSAQLNLENSIVKELQAWKWRELNAWLRTRMEAQYGTKKKLIARIQASMEVSPVSPCPHSRTRSRGNRYFVWKNCASCGKMTMRTSITEMTAEVRTMLESAWTDIAETPLIIKDTSDDVSGGLPSGPMPPQQDHLQGQAGGRGQAGVRGRGWRARGWTSIDGGPRAP